MPPSLTRSSAIDLDEAGVRLRMLVGAGSRRATLAGAVVDVVVALARAVDAVGPVQAGVEPLRRVGRRLLGGEHEAQLVEEGAGVLLRVEIAALPAPIGPGAGEPVEDLARIVLGGRALAFGQRGERGLVGDRAPQPGGDVVLLDRFRRAGTPALRKYFWARMSLATWLHAAGTSMSSSWKTTEPSGLRISLSRRPEFDARHRPMHLPWCSAARSACLCPKCRARAVIPRKPVTRCEPGESCFSQPQSGPGVDPPVLVPDDARNP